jgi:hypothetical protein
MVQAICEGLTMANQITLKRLKLPPLYASGVVYKRERPIPMRLKDGRIELLRVECFDDCELVYQRKWGDCDDLASIRCAELRNAGEHAGIRVTFPEKGKRLYHVTVRRADGTFEDPSRECGMK